MNFSSSIPFNRCTQVSADDFANPLEEGGLHRLWRRPAPPVASTWHPLTRGLWPLQLALDRVEKVERTVTKHLFWLTKGHFEPYTMAEWFQMRFCTVETEYSSSSERIQNPGFTPHLKQHQRDLRTNLLNWGLRDRRARIEICSKQLHSMNLHHYAPPLRGIKPKVLFEPAVCRYLDRLRGCIEEAYDQRREIPSTSNLPQPTGRPTSGQLSDILIGIDLLLNQFQTSSGELALHRYINRCNWGRFLVKLSLLAPVATLCCPWGGLFKLSGFGVGLIGLAAAAGIWAVSFEKSTDEISFSAKISTSIGKLILELLDREDDERAREGMIKYLEEREEFGTRREQLHARQNGTGVPCSTSAGVSRSTNREELCKVETTRDEIANCLAREEEALSSKKKALNTIEKIREDLRKRGVDCEAVFESIMQTNLPTSPAVNRPEVAQSAMPQV